MIKKLKNFKKINNPKRIFKWTSL